MKALTVVSIQLDYEETFVMVPKKRKKDQAKIELTEKKNSSVHKYQQVGLEHKFI